MTVRSFILLLTALALSACSSTRWDHSQSQHIVRKGETLYSISFRYGIDADDLARWNNLGDGSP